MRSVVGRQDSAPQKRSPCRQRRVDFGGGGWDGDIAVPAHDPDERPPRLSIDNRAADQERLELLWLWRDVDQVQLRFESTLDWLNLLNRPGVSGDLLV